MEAVFSTSEVSPHEIVVVNEGHYMELNTEMGDWVEADGIDEEATITVCISFEVLAPSSSENHWCGLYCANICVSYI
jgi:hypothetical protein